MKKRQVFTVVFYYVNDSLMIYRNNPTIWYNFNIYKCKRSLLYRITDFEFGRGGISK
jgi:hypothetical protein